MNYYLIAVLLIIGAFCLGGGLSIIFNYDNQSRSNFIHKECPTMTNECLSRLNIEPVTPIIASILAVLYVVFACKILIKYEKPKEKSVSHE